MIPLAVALALLATCADAHGTLPNGGGFYAGLAHPFLAWEHLLLALGLGLLLGRAGRPRARLALVCLAGALGLGLGLETFGIALPLSTIGILGLAVLGGVLVASALPLPVAVLAVAGGSAGLLIGSDTGVPPPQGPLSVGTFMPYAGVFVGIFLIVLDAMVLASIARRPPWTIAVRIAGSWIAAAALMVLALQVRRTVGIS